MTLEDNKRLHDETSVAHELSLLRLLADVGEQLEGMRDLDKALRISLRLAREFLGAQEACIAMQAPADDHATRVFSLPADAPFAEKLFTAYLQGERRDLPRDTLFAPIRRRGRLWAVLGFTNGGEAFDRQELRDIARFASVVSKEIQRIDHLRTAEVRARIDRKIMEQLRPKDLFYQILHGLRSLTHYDHSAAVFIAGEEHGTLELVAEQIAWEKGKSRRIGTRLKLGPQLHELLTTGEVYGFDRGDEGWTAWRGEEAHAVAEVLDLGEAAVAHGSMLCAPLATREGLIGVLKVAALSPGTFGPYEADLVQRFRPQVTVAMRNLRRAASLETSVVEAEKKHALADLARGVSHDINNAFGSVFPLVQQLLADARAGRLEHDVLVEDLEQIEGRLQVCRRIFGGMLQFAKLESHHVGGGNVRRAVEATLGLLSDGMQRQGIQVRSTLADSLPHVNATQSELEQLVLNVASNARDAMEAGGDLEVLAEVDSTGEVECVRLSLRDTGVGISEEDLTRIREPFFTTKQNGSGIGLSVCRSILRKMGGRMEIQSELGVGTRVTLELPVSSVGLTLEEDDEA